MAATLEIIRHRSDHGAWDLVRAAVPPDLAAHVVDLAGFEELRPSPLLRHEVPTPKCVLVINFGAPFELLYRHETARYDVTAGSFVAGLHDQATQNRSTGLARCLQANFTPLGARLFFARPLRELANCIVGLEDLLGGEAGSLEDRLAAAADWPERFRILGALIRRRIAAATMPGQEVFWALRQLERSDGDRGVAGLARELGVSRKHLVQRFRAEIGLPPKLVGRMLRFERALRSLDGEESLAQLALRAGYYDQAHFNRDFRAFAGFSPREYLARQLPDRTGVVGDEQR